MKMFAGPRKVLKITFIALLIGVFVASGAAAKIINAGVNDIQNTYHHIKILHEKHPGIRIVKTK